MPMFKAMELCPEAVVIPTNMQKYRAVSAQIREIFVAATPVIEPVSLDEAYLDLSAEHRVDDGPAARALAVIAARVEDEIGITVSIGLSANKFLAKLASDMEKPRGFSVIGAAEARSFLAGLPIGKINGVGAVMQQRMEASGIVTIGDLQALSEMELVSRFGRFGRRLAQYAQGGDDRAVTPDRTAKSVSAETTFRADIATVDQLFDVAGPLCERVAGQLQRKGMAGSTVVLKLKTSDFRIMTRNRRLAAPTQRAEVIADVVRQLIARHADGRSFRLIGVGVDGLCPAGEADPPDLFG
jgi:DNA polymerase-4